MKPFFIIFAFELDLKYMILHSSLSDFLLFLYVHMSHADNSYDPLEMAAIKEKMSDLFSKDIDLERKLYLTIREYNSFDKSKLDELFKDTFDHFGEDPSLTSDVYNDLREIIQADGNVNPSEHKALESLKQLIDHHSKKG